MSATHTLAVKGADPAKMVDTLLDKFGDKLRAIVKEELISVDEAVTAMTERTAELTDWREEMEAEVRKVMVPGSGSKYDFGAVGKAMAFGGTRDDFTRYCPNEWEASQQLAQSISPDGSGGFFVPGEVRTDLMVEKVRPRSVVLGLGATEMNFGTTPVDIPREGGTVVAVGDRAENETLAEDQVDADNLRLTPRMSGFIIKGSREFFEMGGPAVDTFIRKIMAREMRIDIDTKALTGTGGKQPIGLRTAPGVNEVTFDATTNEAALANDLVALQQTPLEAGDHEVLESPGWAFGAKVERAIRTVSSQSATGSTDDVIEVIQTARRILSDAKETRVYGEPFRATPLLSSGTNTDVFYGDWEEMLVAFFGAMQMESTESGGTSFEDHQRWIKTTQKMDIGLWHPAGFARAAAGYDLSTF